jgi:hypothetical protein
MARINTAGAGSESHEQAMLVQWWRIAGSRLAPNAVLAAIPNGGARGAVTGARLKREGVVKGMPDLILCCARSGRHALFIEMKRGNGRVSEAQRDLFPLLEAHGYGVAICRGWISAMDTIKAYLAGNWEPSRG